MEVARRTVNRNALLFFINVVEALHKKNGRGQIMIPDFNDNMDLRMVL
tara:strand:+ start:333 stop:476 length:144 start_codon:yes stop_codon:yes gene_type:complete